MGAPIEIYKAGSLGGTLTLVVIAGCTLALVGVAVVALRRSAHRRRLANAEEASVEPARPLVEGEVVLTGTVEHAPACDVAVRVEVTQAGSEAESSGSWSHRWEESDRQVVVAPFYLRRPDGTRVRVEPPPDVDVADELDGKVLVSRTSRVLSAELVPGEQIHARGWLERSDEASPQNDGGYREAAWGWVLRPVRRHMLLSSEPLGVGLRQRAAFHARYGLLALLALAAVQASLAPYYLRFGYRVELARVDRTRFYTTKDSDGDTTSHHAVDVRLTDGRLASVEVSAGDWGRVDRGDSVVVHRSGGAWELGPRPTISLLHAGVLIAWVVMVAWSYRHYRRTSRPWFRRRVVHQGAGRLDESPEP